MSKFLMRVTAGCLAIASGAIIGISGSTIHTAHAMRELAGSMTHLDNSDFFITLSVAQICLAFLLMVTAIGLALKSIGGGNG